MRSRLDLESPADPAKLSAFIAQCLKRPSDYGYSGDLDLFRTWGYVPRLGVHRDSEPLDRSNHRVALEVLGETVPGDFETIRNSHWLVGWSTGIAVRLLEADRSTPTRAALVAFNLMAALDGYPVLDEDDFSQEETADCQEAWDGFGRRAFKDLVAKALGGDWTILGTEPKGDGDPWLDLVNQLDRDWTLNP